MPLCQACGVPLTGEGLTCTACGQRHRCVVTIPKIEQARTAYQAAKLLVQAGLSNKSVQQLAAALQFRPVVLKTQRPLPPVVAAELVAAGSEAVESVEALPAWQARLASLHERYGVGPGVWKPVALLLALMLAQQVVLAAGPGAEAVARDIAEHEAGRARFEEARESQAEQIAKAPARAEEARRRQEQAERDRRARAEAQAAREAAAAPIVEAEQNDSRWRVTYEPVRADKKCYFRARPGYAEVKVRAYDHPFMCRRCERKLVWEGTLSAGEESENLEGMGIQAYSVEAEGKEMSMNGFSCFGSVPVPMYDPDLFPRKPEEN